jgi:prepilin-type N-terminal cleavage/methylation domain-containing protein
MTTKKAFTLIELMVVLGVIAILSAMAIFGITLLNRSVETTQRKNVLKDLQIYLEGYKNQNGIVPLTSQVVYNNTQKKVFIDNTDTGVKFYGEASEYCYSGDGATYSMGVKVNGKNEYQGTATVNCTLP